MAVKRQPTSLDSEIVHLVIDRQSLKSKVQERISLGEEIPEREITTEHEKQQMWTDFMDWNNYSHELLRQAFDKPKNIYTEEYKYKAPVYLDALYGPDKTFHEMVQDEKSTIKFQVKKLRRFYEKIDLMKVLDSVPKSDSSKSKIVLLTSLLNKFHRIAQTLRERHDHRETIIVRDEYDVQDLLNSLLQLYFDDVRKEDSSPSHAGANSRLDFVLKIEGIIIEVKITSERLSTKKLGEDLLVDISRYKVYPDCNDLVIFIYDKGDFISNKVGFINDLQRHSTSTLKVGVVINPK